MEKPSFEEELKNLNEGKKVENPAYHNPSVAKAIATEWIKEELKSVGLVKEELRKCIFSYFGKHDLAKQVLNYQPFYYDESKLWWYWDDDVKCWKITDETNILNFVDDLATGINTVNSKEKNEILEALKQESRKNKPIPIKPTWIQFRDKIFDIENGNETKASSKYFVVNPLPWELSKDKIESTPVMDRIFEEWVGKEHIQTLYEIIAYCMLPDYPIHRLFCLIGAGLNGKSCFLRLIERFIGKSNVCSTELDTLINSRFEVTRLHKKLVCIMGETDFGELSKTSILKKLTGQDIIGFEYKNKNPFDDWNYAKIIISTNNLPETTDKTIGFYRRWLIIDFPNQFSEEKDILADIPAEEYESLALKCCNILHDLLKVRKFTREGTIEDRMKKYEDKSDPITKFLKEQTEESSTDINKADFEQKLNSWCKSNRFRQMSEVAINKKMTEIGIQESRVWKEWYENQSNVRKQVRVWLGIKWRYGL